MITSISAPDDEALRSYRLGTLPDEEVARVERWMNANPELAGQRFEAIDATDTFVDAVVASDTTPKSGKPQAGGMSPPPEIGDYRIGGQLGAGGMGVVYAAENKFTQQPVAIKFITPQFAGDPHIRERFLREARAVGKINHPNVVPIQHVGEDNGLLYFVMPLLHGETLAARLEREKPMPADDLMRITCDMAAGLAAAHGVGLIHRDIKPANVWLDADTGRARILDFGLVKPMTATTDGLTETGAVMGTVFYMSPEQAEGKLVDARTDLFSLGAVAYHAATGEVPFKGDSKLAVLIAVKTKAQPSPEKLNAKLSGQLASLIQALLEKKPEDRPNSATDVIDELQGNTIPRRSPRWQSMRRWQRALTGLAALFVVGVAVAVYQIEFKTKEGTLVVQVDGDADVRFKNGELHIYDEDGKLTYKLRPGEPDRKLRAGAYTVKVIGASGVVLDTPEFKMTKNETVTIRVTAKPDAPLMATDPDRKAAEYVLSIGGTVRVNDESRERRDAADLPVGSFRLTQVDLRGNRKVSDEALAHFKDCDTLMQLNVSDTQVSDKGLFAVKNCKNLRMLTLQESKVTAVGINEVKKSQPQCSIEWNGGPIEPSADPDRTAAKYVLAMGGKIGVNRENDFNFTHNIGDPNDIPQAPFRLTLVFLRGKAGVNDAGLAAFKGCKNIMWLDLRETQISDAGLALFKDCKNLKVIDLGNTKAGDEGLRHFNDCKKLTDLATEGTQITDAGLAHFKDCKWTSINARNTNMSDAALAAFADLKNVETLWLTGTQITNVGLTRLKVCKNMTGLLLFKTKVTKEGVAELHKAIPQCKIETDFGEFRPKTN